MNEHTPVETTFLKEMGKGFKEMFLSFKKRKLRKGILSTSSYDAIYKSIKDYIQPIIKIFIVIIIVSFGLESTGFSNDDLMIIFLGVMYTIFYIFSSISSMNAYRVKNWFKGAKRAMDILYYLFAGILLLISIFIWRNIPIVVIFIFLFIYVFENIRRPLGVDYLGDLMKKDQRATMLSVEAQIKSFLVFIFAPLFGLIADYSIPLLFGILAGIMVLVNLFLQGNGVEKTEPVTTHNQK